MSKRPQAFLASRSCFKENVFNTKLATIYKLRTAIELECAPNNKSSINNHYQYCLDQNGLIHLETGLQENIKLWRFYLILKMKCILINTELIKIQSVYIYICRDTLYICMSIHVCVCVHSVMYVYGYMEVCIQKALNEISEIKFRRWVFKYNNLLHV